MHEYGNFYDREDTYFLGSDILRSYELQHVINEARTRYPDNFEKQKELVEKECSYYWPIEDRNIDVLKFAGLLERSQDYMVQNNLYKQFDIKLSPVTHCVVRAFYYQEKRWFYWWDLYNDSTIQKSGLEFFPWKDHPATYIIFATTLDQSPLICTEQFKHVRQD